MDAKAILKANPQNRERVRRELKASNYHDKFLSKALDGDQILYVEARYFFDGKKVRINGKCGSGIKYRNDIGIITDVNGSLGDDGKLLFTVDTESEGHAVFEDHVLELVEE